MYLLTERKKILVGEVVKDAQYYKGGLIANLMCTPSEINELPFYDYGKIGLQKTPILRGMIFYIDSNKKTIDLGNPNDNYNYPIANITENLLSESNSNNGITIRDFFSAEGLLSYLGFKEQLTLEDIQIFKQIINKQKEVANIAKACGYRKINKFLTSPLDYEQEIKLGKAYYKFTGSQIAEDDKCKYKEKEIFPKPIKGFKIFELLASNVSFGYEVSEQEKKLSR